MRVGDRRFEERASDSVRTKNVRRRSLVGYYLAILFGFITFVFGFVSLAVYLGVLYLSPIISNLTGLSFVNSRFLVLALTMITAAGFFTSTYPVSKAVDGNSSLHIILAFGTSAVALGVQVYKLATLGPTWVGIDLLGPSGNTLEMMYLTAIYFVFSLILFVLEFTMLRNEFTEREL